MPASYLPDRLFKNPAFVDIVPISPYGFVKLVRVDGDDDFIALSARHGKESDNPTPKLIRYMMRHNHTTPFEMVGLVFHLKMPMFVANQWKRHRMATINELSLRYDEATGEYWLPQGGKWRKQSTNNHQGSTDELIEIPALRCEAAGMMNLDAEEVAFEEYKSRIAQGASREQARSCLPVSIYTDFFWKVDLHNCFRFLKLRLDPHAQAEIREMSQIVEGFVRQAFPIAYAAWVDCVRDAITLTVQDQKALGNLLAGKQSSPSDWPSKREADEYATKVTSVVLRSTFKVLVERGVDKLLQMSGGKPLAKGGLVKRDTGSKPGNSADVMTVEQFVNACNCNALTDEDGIGYFCTNRNTQTEHPAIPSKVFGNLPEKFVGFSHVAWYNK